MRSPSGLRSTASAGRDPRCPVEYGLGISFIALILVTAVLEAARSSIGVGLASTITIAVVAILAWWVRPMAAIGAGALGWLLLNGFVVDGDGDLHWHGHADVVRLVLLLSAAAALALVRSVQLSARRRFQRIPPDLSVGDDGPVGSGRVASTTEANRPQP